MGYGLVLKKENFKFSASHFTIFSSDHAEALHGHNYQVMVRLEFDSVDAQTEMKADFKSLKEKIKVACETLDEKILVPEKSPFLKISESPHYKKHIQVEYNNRFYCFPTDEVMLLPLANITSEALARHLWTTLSTAFKKDFKKVVVAVKETAGQSAIYSE